MKFKMKIFLLTIVLATASLISCIEKPEASDSLNLIVNGHDITSTAMPIVENNRTLVPVRFISEELGAKVTWNDADKTILIEKEGNTVLLKIDSRLINYNNGEDYDLSDVESKLLAKDEEGNSRTYVPLRLISNALDIGIEWNEEENNVYIDNNKKINKEAISSVEIISQNKNEKISGKTNLQINSKKEYEEGSKIEFLLLDKGQTSGFIIQKGKDISKKYTYTPKIEDNGHKILVAIIYDKNGVYLDGDAIPIEIKVEPKVQLSISNKEDSIKGAVDLSANINFFPLYVKYEIKRITNSGEGKPVLTDVNDPLGTFTWNPMMSDNGLHSIRVIAYDSMDNPYYSEAVIVNVDKERVLTLGGVKEGMLIDKGVNLIANRNFDVSETEYLIKDLNTGNISTLAKIPYGGYTWNPGPDDSGKKELFVRVVEKGKSYESRPVMVTVDGNPKVFLEGIGPGQVINKDVTLTASSNVDLENLKYIITDLNTNKKRQITSNEENNKVLYKPMATEKGNMTIEVQGEYKGKKISSEKINFEVYQGEFFGPKAIVKKDEFIPMASNLAVDSYQDIGMSAALQTAQAILETGWGQSVPVDKYKGVLSNNLFGIKGEGTTGSVTSNTWEVYNGQKYRVDAGFRAYDGVSESWKDHKNLLLNRDRYKPFTEVMFDYTKGAWGLKRAGYATDPEYPIKLIKLINTYNLAELDKVDI